MLSMVGLSILKFSHAHKQVGNVWHAPTLPSQFGWAWYPQLGSIYLFSALLDYVTV